MKYIGLLMCTVLLTGKSWACWCVIPPPLTKAILSQYPYVALVKVKTMDQLLRPVNSPKPRTREGRFTVDVLENFGKTLPDTLILESFRTSCDIGLRPGQTWIVFAKLINGQAVVYACDYSVPYDREPERGSGYQVRYRTGDEVLNSLRQFTGRPIRAKDNKLEQFYPNGQRALLTTYRRGGVEEERTVWYASGRLAGKESYRNGAIDGRASWWYANGNPMVDETFAEGMAIDTSRRWYNNDTDSVWVQTTPVLTPFQRDSTLRASRQSNLQSISIADKKGQLLRSAQYSREGWLTDETIAMPETGVTCRTAYDKQGHINFLIVTRAVPSPVHKLTQQLVYRIDYEKDGSRQVAYYDSKGRLTRWVRVKDGREVLLEEKRYPD